MSTRRITAGNNCVVNITLMIFCSQLIEWILPAFQEITELPTDAIFANGGEELYLAL